MPLKPQKYRSTKAQAIADERTRAAFEDQAQRLEQLARDVEARIAANTPPDPFKPGMIIFWLGTVADIPAGWSEATELRGRFPRGMASGGTPGATGGTDKHTHGTGGSLSGNGSTTGFNPVSSGVNLRDGTGATASVALFPHVHNISETTTLPPYVDGIWIRKD